MNNPQLIEKKMTFFHDIVQKTILNVQKMKNLDILGISEVTSCIILLNTLSAKLKNIDTKSDTIIESLQTINNELVNIIKIYGTESLEDLLILCFGPSFIQSIVTAEDISKFELLSKYFHPTSIDDKKVTEKKKLKNKMLF